MATLDRREEICEKKPIDVIEIAELLQLTTDFPDATVILTP